MSQASNHERFAKALAEFGERAINVDYLKLRRMAALIILRGVVLKTPVDSGRARGNWQLFVGGTTESEVPGVTRTVGKGKKRKKRWQATSQKGDSAAKRLNSKDDKFKSVFVFNNVPYINKLEQGYSRTKAPQGMVMVTLLEVENILTP